MTKIKNYNIDQDVTANDKWIGSDSANLGRTKNFTPKGIAKYFNDKQIINSSNQLRFVYDTIELGDSRIPGSFSFETEVGDLVPFSFISSLVFSGKARSGYSVSSFIDSMIGSKIIIQKTNAPDVFAYYTLNSFDERVSEPNFYDASLSFLNGSGAIETDEDYFISLISDVDKSFEFMQSVPSSTWTINHNLGKYPSVSVVNNNNILIYGETTYIDKDNLTVSFSAGFSGKAFLN